MKFLLASSLAVLLVAIFSSSVHASNTAGRALITSSTRIGEGQLRGPESIEFDDKGFAYVSVGDGSIRKVNVTDGTQTVYAYSVKIANRSICAQENNATAEAICGRPLGLKFDKQYNLYVCDAYYGLLFVPRANPSNVTVLANSSNGVKFGFTNALVINQAQDTIYLTDTSPTDPRSAFLKVFLEAKPQGRLVRYNIRTGETTTLLSDLVFGNGVLFNKNETELIINETSLKRIRRYYLTGPKAGTSDFFNSDIGGYPDNLDFDPVSGNFLVACNTEGFPDLDAIIPGISQTALYAQIVALIPPKGFIVVINSNGDVQRTLYDITGQFVASASEAQRQGDYIYVGSVVNPYLTRIPASLLTKTLYFGIVG